jgi:RimJ/RimL family protein N-acetyltransferase
VTEPSEPDDCPGHESACQRNFPAEQGPLRSERLGAGCDDGFVIQATLHTDRIKLVPLSDEHRELEVELDSDPEVMRYLTGRGRTRAQVMAAHQLRLATAEPVPGLGFWVGFVGEQFVGWWLLEPPGWAEQRTVEGQAELGYRLLRRHWRQGLASEGSRELLRHAFEDLGLHRVFAQTMTVNSGSRATMAAVGLQYIRTFHDDDDEGLPGSELGGVEYAITRDEWRAATLEPDAQPSSSH